MNAWCGRIGFPALTRRRNTGRSIAISTILFEMGRAAFLILALATAAMAAMLTGSVAHDEFGISLEAIRTDALGAAALIFAAIACGSLLTRRK